MAVKSKTLNILKTCTKSAFVVCGIYVAARLYTKLYHQYYNYPRGKLGLPLFGCFFDLKRDGKQFLYSLALQYGSISMISMGIQTHIYINDSKLASKILKNKYLYNRPRFNNFEPNYFSFTFLSDHQWERRRGLINRMFLKLVHSSVVLRSTKKALNKYIIAEIEETITQHNLWYPLSSAKYLTFNVIFNLLFGIDLPKDEGMYINYTNTVTTKIEPATKAYFLWSTMFNLPFIPNRIFWKIFGLKDSTKYLINLFKEFLKSANLLDSNGNLKQYNNVQNDENIPYIARINKNSLINMNEVISDCNGLLSAGWLTTAEAICYGLLLLVKYPLIQHKIYNEIKNILLKYNCSELNDYKLFNQLHLLRAFIYEILRMSCIAPTGLPHICDKNLLIDYIDNKTNKKCKCLIPKGCTIFINIDYIHKNEYENFDKLNLNNWLNENNKFSKKSNKPFVTFGLGRRNCVGKTIAIKSLYATFSLLMTKYKFVAKDNNTNFDIQQIWTDTAQTIHPQIGIKVVRRSESSDV